MEVILRKSNRKDKKYVAVMENMKHHFGGAGYEDFTTHKDPDRKERYIQKPTRKGAKVGPTIAGAKRLGKSYF